MARKITIEILGIDWYIEDKELLGKDDDSEDSLYFANWSCYKNKIVHLHDCITVKLKILFWKIKCF